MNFIQNTPIFNRINIPSVPFRSTTTASYSPKFEPIVDSFNTNPIIDKNTLNQIARTNPRIREISKEYNIPIKVNEKELEKLQKNHLTDTRIIAAKIYSSLPAELKSEVNLKNLQEAAMLHDYGKALIPEKILNKDGKLNDKEKAIMDLHSELGYELLKDQGINKEVLNLVKYHHQKPDGSGYPAIAEDFKADISSEILAAADKYSALREERSYKAAMSKDEALDVLQKELPEEIFKALKQIN